MSDQGGKLGSLAAISLLCALSGACSQGQRREGVAIAPVDASATIEASAPLLAEVGFLDVPAQPSAAQYKARLFYVFEPANLVRSL